MDWLEQYTSILLMNLLGTQLRKYFGKYLQCLKIISTSWILNRSVGRICRMDAFYYYIWRSSNIPLTKFFNWIQYEILFLCVFFPFTTCLNKFKQGWKENFRPTDFSIFWKLILYRKNILFELHIHKPHIPNLIGNIYFQKRISKTYLIQVLRRKSAKWIRPTD